MRHITILDCAIFCDIIVLGAVCRAQYTKCILFLQQQKYIMQ